MMGITKQNINSTHHRLVIPIVILSSLTVYL